MIVRRMIEGDVIGLLRTVDESKLTNGKQALALMFEAAIGTILPASPQPLEAFIRPDRRNTGLERRGSIL